MFIPKEERVRLADDKAYYVYRLNKNSVIGSECVTIAEGNEVEIKEMILCVQRILMNVFW